MKKNLKSCIELNEYEDATVLLDMNGYDWIASCGMKPDLSHKKNAHLTGAWAFGSKTEVRIPLDKTDLTPYRYLTFSAFAVQGEGGSFSIRFESDEEVGGDSGYSLLLPITRNGWNDYRVELPTMPARKKPLGWGQVGAIVLNCVIGGQVNSADTVLSFDNFYLWESNAPKLYEKMPELKGAVMFSKSAPYAIVDRKRIANAPDGNLSARPFEKDGVLWLPIAPIAGVLAHHASVDNKANTLSFTYRRKKYAFSGESEAYTVDGELHRLGFLPKILGGVLFFPATYVMEFFRWRQIFTSPIGLIILSNRRNVFEVGRDSAIIRMLNAEITFVQPSAVQILEDFHRKVPNGDRCRLLLTHDEWFSLRKKAKEDGDLRKLVDLMKNRYGKRSECYLAESDGDLSAESCENLIAWAVLYRITGDKAYALRVLDKLTAIAKLDSWGAENSIHSALQVGFASALAYDWCRQAWSEAQKAVIERAMLRYALRPASDCLRGKGNMWRVGTAESAENYCASIALAFALAEAYRETSFRIFKYGMSGIVACFEAYAPDGGYPEGISAWESATKSLGLIIAMFASACGSTYGFHHASGFAQTVAFAEHLETKSGIWNLAGAKQKNLDTSIFAWFGKFYNKNAVGWLRRQDVLSGIKPISPYDICFYSHIEKPDALSLPLDSVWKRAGIATLRSSWESDANLIALHGGSNHEVGGVLDAGSFLLEMGGIRFLTSIDGCENLPKALTRRAEGHNTVVVNPPEENYPDQDVRAIAKTVEAKSATDRAFAVVDMTSTHEDLLRAKRGILLYAHRSVAVVQDEMQFAESGSVVWNAYTEGEILRNGGRTLLLSLGGKILLCRIYGGGNAKFEVEKVENTPYSHLKIRVDVKERLRLAVAFALTDAVDAKLYDLQPMTKWEELQ